MKLKPSYPSAWLLVLGGADRLLQCGRMSEDHGGQTAHQAYYLKDAPAVLPTGTGNSSYSPVPANEEYKLRSAGVAVRLFSLLLTPLTLNYLQLRLLRGEEPLPAIDMLQMPPIGGRGCKSGVVRDRHSQDILDRREL